MKVFSILASALVAAVTVSAAATGPARGLEVIRRDGKCDTVLSSVGKLADELESSLGISGLTGGLDNALGGTVTDLEKALGLSCKNSRRQELSGKLVHKRDDKCNTVLSSVGKLADELESSLGISGLTGGLDKALGGIVTDLEKTLGLEC